jgi:hypothetical protein
VSTIDMQVQYQLTAEDFWQSTLAWRKARTGRRWSFRLLPILCILLLTLSVISVWQNPQYRRSTPILVMGAFVMVAAWLRPRLRARRAPNMPLNRGPMVLEVSDSGLHFRSAVEDSKVSWSAFIGWAEGSVVFRLIS